MILIEHFNKATNDLIERQIFNNRSLAQGIGLRGFSNCQGIGGGSFSKYVKGTIFSYQNNNPIFFMQIFLPFLVVHLPRKRQIHLPRKQRLINRKDIDTRLTKAWTAIDRLSIIWKSNLTDEMKRNFFQAAVVSILLYGCTTWTLTKRLEMKLDGNYTRMLRAILNRSWQ